MNKENRILVNLLEKNNVNWELLPSNNVTKLITNQIKNGINKPEEILIVNHFVVALIILNNIPSKKV